MIDLLVSNSIEELFDHFVSRVVMKKELIVVQDIFIKSYLQQKLCQRLPSKAIFGLEILTVQESVEHILFLMNQSKRIDPFATFLDLAVSTYVLEEKVHPFQAALQSWYGVCSTKQVSNYSLDPSLRHISQEIHLEPYGSCPYDAIHLFAVTALCPHYHHFFSSIAKRRQVFFYVLSPCMMFWADICSSNQMARLEHLFGVVDSSGDATTFVNCSFLANSAFVAKEYARLLEESICMAKEAYVVPAWAEFGRYDAVSAVDQSKKTLLEQLKADLLLLQEPKACPVDESIELHAVPTLIREVEVLYDNLVAIDSVLETASVIVYAPSIELYRPYIERVFPKNSYQIIGKEVVDPEGVINGFFALLRGCINGFTPESALLFFGCRAVQKKLGVQREDALLLRQCMQRLRAFGKAAHFKEDFLRLWVTNQEPESLELASDEAQKIALFIECIQSLPLQKEPQSLSYWGEYFDTLLKGYFLRTIEEEKEFDLLFLAVELFKKSAASYATHTLGLSSVIELLQISLDRAPFWRDPILKTPIVFSSLGDLRTYPAERICFLGFDQTQFPRTTIDYAVNNGVRSIDSFDKHLMLEALMSVRQKLYISYQSVSSEDQSPLTVSTSILELIEGYNIPVIQHALEEYEPSNQSPISPKDFFVHASKEKLKKNDSITASHLMQVARSPLQPFFQNRGIFLYEKERDSLDDELATIDPSLFRKLKKSAFFLSETQNELFFEKELNYLPDTLKSVCKDIVKSDLEVLKTNGRLLGIDSNQSVSVTFSPSCYQPFEQEKGRWIVPAIQYDAECQLSGSIDMLHSAGVITFASQEFEESIRVLPRVALACYAAQKYAVPIGTDLLFVQTGHKKRLAIQDPQYYLEQFVSYAHSCTHESIALYPEWAKQLLSEKSFPESLLEKEVMDSYLQFFLSKITQEQLGHAWPKWQDLAKNIFSPIADVPEE